MLVVCSGRPPARGAAAAPTWLTHPPIHPRLRSPGRDRRLPRGRAPQGVPVLLRRGLLRDQPGGVGFGCLPHESRPYTAHTQITPIPRPLIKIPCCNPIRRLLPSQRTPQQGMTTWQKCAASGRRRRRRRAARFLHVLRRAAVRCNTCGARRVARASAAAPSHLKTTNSLPPAANILAQVPAGVRVVLLRTGIVLAAGGGVLGKMVPIFSLFAGGRGF